MNEWFYTDLVKEHFFDPQNICRTDDEWHEYKKEATGHGIVGSPACGDVMELLVKIKDDKIESCRWRTFGCASAIASTSMLSVMVTENGGMLIDDALKIKPKDIVNRLHDLPFRKFHCSVLGDKVLRSAINDHFIRTGQSHRVVKEGAQVIDKMMNVTDKDIEEAVLHGAKTFEDVQAKTKVGVKDKNCIPKVNELITLYRKRYFGD